MNLTTVTAPTNNLLTLSYVKKHQLKLETNDDDCYVTDLIRAAREMCETYLDRSFGAGTYLQTLDCFPCGDIELRLPPVTAVNYVKYIDTNGTLQTLSPTAYQVDLRSEPCRIRPAYGTIFPYTRWGDFNSVQIEFDAGYTSLPWQAQRAMLMLIGGWYMMRESISELPLKEVPFGVKALLNNLKWRTW